MTEEAPRDLRDLQLALRQFAAEREWQQFHNPKNLILALVGEVGELAELFQWSTPEQAATLAGDAGKRIQVEHELADVLAYVLRLADVLEVDLGDALLAKMAVNAIRYPISRARGTSQKYSELQEDV